MQLEMRARWGEGRRLSGLVRVTAWGCGDAAFNLLSGREAVGQTKTPLAGRQIDRDGHENGCWPAVTLRGDVMR